jgi:hypothetical protein
VVSSDFTPVFLEIKLRWLTGPRKHVMRAFGSLPGKSKPFCDLARIGKPNILRILLDVLDQLPPLRHLMIPPVVAMGNQNFVAGMKH